MRQIGTAAYKDVIPLLDTALANGGAQFDLATERQAISTIHRMNRWRQRSRDLEGNSPYDRFSIRRFGTHVIIELRVVPVLAAFDLAGNPIELVHRTHARTVAEAIANPINTAEADRSLAEARAAYRQMQSGGPVVLDDIAPNEDGLEGAGGGEAAQAEAPVAIEKP